MSVSKGSALEFILPICEYLCIINLFHPETVPLRTVNRQCSSGLQAVSDVAAYIKAGFYDIGMIASGVCVAVLVRLPLLALTFFYFQNRHWGWS